MSKKLLLYVCLIAIAIYLPCKGNSQAGLCPPNLDFEYGDFTNWECRAGFTYDPILPITGAIPGRHTIIPPGSGFDFFGGFPKLCPNGSGYSIQLGNPSSGKGMESISYTYTIPSTLTSFSILFFYAVVLESPGHGFSDQPRFQARIIDVTTGAPLPCVDFDFIPGSSTGGFRVSPNTGNGGSQVLYKDWTPISINLNGYIGRTIKLEFITRDCTLGGHAGYAYVDVNTVCSGAIQGSTVCEGDNTTTLTAPFGFQGYTWYADAAFSSIISTSQTVTFTPPPSVGTVYPVIVDPFPGFGCRDTLYATITVSPKPVSDAGADKIVCDGQSIQVGGSATPGYQYSWTPAALVSNPLSPSPFAGPVTAPTEFIVNTLDLLTGCKSADTTVVSNFIVDTTVTVTGNPEFCIGDALPTLSVEGTSAPVQWHEQATGPIPGATAISYQPTVTGIYWAEIAQSGCPDSSGARVITVHPLPVASFTYSDTGCVSVSQLVFSNTSNAPDGAAMSYLWTFSDGMTQTITDAVRSFPRTGSFTVDLQTTTEFGCKNTSAPETIHVLPNGIPNFTWDSICVTRPVLFKNLSNENGSAQAYYSWELNDGNPPVLVKDPPAVTYTGNTRQLNVTLKMTTLGCESDTQTIVKTIQVNRQAPGISYRGFTIPQGSTKWMHVRDTIGNVYSWRPRVQLSNYNAQYTEFTAIDDVTYMIDISDIHTCVTTDTIVMQVLKKPGFYLPTAFTPNGDGLNDLIRPYLVGMKGLKTFTVFNRWGNVVFRSSAYGEGWDGTSHGDKQPAGVYIWALDYYNENNVLVHEKGSLTLIR
jgi:gliding motility-associated-like protein